MPDLKWHLMDIKEVLNQLHTTQNGLNDSEANKRLLEYGENELKQTNPISPLKIFIDQFKNFLVVILIIASIIAIAVGELLDGSLIIAIVVANAVFGFVQDYKAEKSIEALKKLSAPRAIVLRNGRKIKIPATHVVPGDILVLEEGSTVPADARVIKSISIAVDESALTGESITVTKIPNKIKDAVLNERKNMLYMNTSVVRGRGLAVVVATGMNTEIGKIAKEIETIKKEKTPFQKRIDKLGKQIGFLILIATAIVFLTQYFLHEADLLTIFLASVSLAVAAVPEGLPAVTTLALALGVRRMSKKKSLVRRLSVVESLGNVDVICSDKTGTITEGKMKIEKIYFNNSFYSPKNFDAKKGQLLLKCGILCNNAEFDGKITGDPTESAILEFSLSKGLSKKDVNKEYRRVDEIPFSSERKMMSTINEKDGRLFVFSKGAPEIIVKKCNKIYENGVIRKLDENKKQQLLEKNRQMASEALRVLAFAFKPTTKRERYEHDLVFLGLEGMLDPPRKGVKEAIKTCHEAGIRVIMITGDNKLTAQAIAKNIGLGSEALEGSELEKMSKEELAEKIERINIFARVSPLHKVKILDALRKSDHIIAMTGDGVNDAPALKDSDIGIAMGIKGTDTAKQTSDMILMDDNFSTIVSAVHEGRRIFDNIRKFVTYLLGANIAEMLVVFIASIFGRIPLLAAQLLWINLLTDGLPALSLGVDPAAPDIMKRKPQKDNVIDKRMIYTISTIGIVLTAVILYLFMSEPDLVKAQTIAFTSLVIFELVKIQIIRSQFNSGFFTNKYLIITILISILLQLVVLYTPLAAAFKVVPLCLADWSRIITLVIVSSTVSWVIIRNFKYK